MPSTPAETVQPPQPLRRTIFRIFNKKYNLQLHSSALAFITETLESHGLFDQPDEWDEALEALATGFAEREAEADDNDFSASIVTREALEAIYSQLVVAGTSGSASGPSKSHNQQTPHHHHHNGITQGEYADPDKYFHVIDAFKMPRIVFDPQRKIFEKSNVQPTILPAASQKSAYLRERLSIVRSIIQRNENFCPPLALGNESTRDSFMKLTSTKNLLGRQSQRFLLFGMLSTAQDGRYILEDADGCVGLDLDEAIPGEGIFTEGAMILVEGEYTEEERMRVFAIGHPPSETRAAARQIFSHVDFLGTGAISSRDEEAFRIHETSHNDSCFVVLSDLHLDHAKTLSSLATILQGYTDAEFIPFAFVFCGNFCSSPWTTADMVKRYQTAFSNLTDVLVSFPSIVGKSHFVLVPGPADPFSTPLVPRAGLPELFTTKLRAKLGHRIHIATNPCRIKFFNQEIVIYRDDLMARMLRNTVHLKDETREGDLKKFLVSTLLDQAHLCPLPQRIRPVLWEHDHSLRLYPMPTSLILADSYDRFELTYEGCHVFNPGSFRGSSYGWTTYYPATGKIERSELPPT